MVPIVADAISKGTIRGPWPISETGLLSTDSRFLKRLVLTDNPTVKPVLAIRAMEQLLRNFGPKLVEFISPITGRLHPRYKISAAASGRFTSSNPNAQQFPAKRWPTFKKVIVADPGRVLIVCDLSQIELRCAAWKSKEPTMTRVFAEGRDLHTETAAGRLGIPREEVTKEQRNAAKAPNFGAIYGISARSLAIDAFANHGVDMTIQEAQFSLDAFFRTYPLLAIWIEENFKFYLRHGYIEIGEDRIYRGQWAIETGGQLNKRQCTSYVISGLCAELLLRGIKLVDDRLPGLEACMVFTVHDELGIDAAERDAAAAKAILEESLVEAFEISFPGAPTRGVAEAGIGKTWFDAKP
jgi:DNA polymerase-1